MKNNIKINNTVLSLASKGVLNQEVDAIVNAANTSMRGGGGLDAAVHISAGNRLVEELTKLAPNGVNPGDVILSKGFQLKQSYILHAVGPTWSGGNKHEEELLKKTYLNCMKIADKKEDIHSIAFCCLSSGIFRFPLEKATSIAVQTVIEYLQDHPNTNLTKIIFATFKQQELTSYKADFFNFFTQGISHDGAV